jgi:hypothetical protein
VKVEIRKTRRPSEEVSLTSSSLGMFKKSKLKMDAMPVGESRGRESEHLPTLDLAPCKDCAV